MKVREGRIIDGNISNNDAKYVNHSCRPNCKLERWEVNNEERPVMFAKTRIKRGTELTFDYDWTVKDARDQVECHCIAGKIVADGCRDLMCQSNNIQPEKHEKQMHLPPIFDGWVTQSIMYFREGVLQS